MVPFMTVYECPIFSTRMKRVICFGTSTMKTRNSNYVSFKRPLVHATYDLV